MRWRPDRSIWQPDPPRRDRLVVLSRDRWIWIPQSDIGMLPFRSLPMREPRHKNIDRPPWAFRRMMKNAMARRAIGLRALQRLGRGADRLMQD